MLRCIAVDDEPLALEVLESYIRKVPSLQLVGLCGGAMEAIRVLSPGAVDLVFLDVDMPDLTGTQLLRTLKHPPLVVFTTAYPDYALEGFELDAVDYLLKPIPFDRFLRAVNKAQERLHPSHPPAPVPGAPPAAPAPEADFIFVKTEYKTLRVDLDDILYVEGLKDYVLIHTRQKKIITLLSLNKMVEKLPPTHFLRVHRSFIVAVNKMDSIERNRIRICEAEIPVGDLYRDGLGRWVR
jgi:DNA-binding LytR/AlgR family response regulator